MVAMTRIVLLCTRECALQDHTLFPNNYIGLLCPKSIVFDLCSNTSVQGKWLVLSCPLFGGFTELEGNIYYQILPPNLNIGGAGAPPPPSPPQLLRPWVRSIRQWSRNRGGRGGQLPPSNIFDRGHCPSPKILSEVFLTLLKSLLRLYWTLLSLKPCSTLNMSLI